MTTKIAEADDGGNEPTTDAVTEGIETVHRASGWLLTVRANGSVETHEMGVTRIAPVTTRDEWFGMEGEHRRCGKSIEGVLARYVYETRFERGLEEHGAALRRGIIDALCAIATDATCGRKSCDGDAAYVSHTNAPTGPSTALVCDEHATEGTYTTLYAFEKDTDNEAGESS